MRPWQLLGAWAQKGAPMTLRLVLGTEGLRNASERKACCPDLHFSPAIYSHSSHWRWESQVPAPTMTSPPLSGYVPLDILYLPHCIKNNSWSSSAYMPPSWILYLVPLELPYSNFWTLATQSSIALARVSAPVRPPHNLIASYQFLPILVIPMPELGRNHLG